MVSTPIPRSYQPTLLKHRMTMEPPHGPRGGQRQRQRLWCDDEGMTACTHEQERTARSRGEQACLPPPLTALTQHPGATLLSAMWQPNDDQERRRCPTHGATTKLLTWHPSMPYRCDFPADTPPTDDDAHTPAPTPIYTTTPAPTNDNHHPWHTQEWLAPHTNDDPAPTNDDWVKRDAERAPTRTMMPHPWTMMPTPDNDDERRGTTPTEMTPCWRTANEATTDERQRVPTPMYVPPPCMSPLPVCPPSLSVPPPCLSPLLALLPSLSFSPPLSVPLPYLSPLPLCPSLSPPLSVTLSVPLYTPFL